jgi:hypothetical protein
LVFLLTAVLIAAIVLLVVFIIRGRVGSRSSVLPITQEENLTILENGDAVLRLSTTTSPSQLVNLYRRSIDAIGENAVISAFREGVQNEYKILANIDVNVVDSQISIDSDNMTRLFVEATAQGVPEFNSLENAWEIDIGPQDENGNKAVGFMLMQMMFSQQMLKSLPENENQKLECTSSLPINLPDDATIVNAGELSRKKWRVDFGGGNYREASLHVLSSHEVSLTEKIVVTENPPSATNENLFKVLFNYRIFTIKYKLPSHSMEFAAATIGAKIDPAAEPNSTFSWVFGWTVSCPFSQAFPYSTDGISAQVDLTGTVDFAFDWYIGWDFELTSIMPPVYELQWFRTYVDINPQVNINATTTITAQLTHEWEQDIYNWSHPVTFFIGPVPVVIEARADIGAGVEVGAQANLSVTAGVNASTTFTLGVEWTKVNGWGPIAERDFVFNPVGPEITASAEAWVTPYLTIRLGAYFYYTAGPFVELEPLAKVSLTPDNWLIEAGFDINAGVGFGTISDWIDLSDWSTTLYSWRIPIASSEFLLIYNTYTNEKYSFRFDYPKNWDFYAEDIGLPPPYVAYFDAGSSTGLTGEIGLYIFDKVGYENLYNVPLENLTAYIASLEKQFENNENFVVRSPPTVVSVDNHNGVRLMATFLQLSYNVRLELETVVKDNYFYAFEITAPEENYSAIYRPIFERVVGSFSLLD